MNAGIDINKDKNEMAHFILTGIHLIPDNCVNMLKEMQMCTKYH